MFKALYFLKEHHQERISYHLCSRFWITFEVQISNFRAIFLPDQPVKSLSIHATLIFVNILILREFRNTQNPKNIFHFNNLSFIRRLRFWRLACSSEPGAVINEQSCLERNTIFRWTSSHCFHVAWAYVGTHRLWYWVSLTSVRSQETVKSVGKYRVFRYIKRTW